MGKQLTLKEYDEINRLHKTGMKQKDIAKIFGKAISTISEIVKQNGRVKFKKDGSVAICGEVVERRELMEEDLSSLPDNILFKHDNSFIF